MREPDGRCFFICHLALLQYDIDFFRNYRIALPFHSDVCFFPKTLLGHTLLEKGCDEPMIRAILWAAGGTGFTFLMTALGAAVVLFLGTEIKMSLQRTFLGFAAGVMMAASVWSLLIPAIERAKSGNFPPVLIAGTGLVAGVFFLMVLDRLIPHLHPDTGAPEGISSGWKRTTLLFLAVTLHNIPEGMAVGLSFALAAQGEDFSAAMALAVGIGIQNLPEGAAVSLPLRQEGMSRRKAFGRGVLSGFVEPVFGILVVLGYGFIQPVMPFLLSFAAGAMLYVVVEELIPEAHLDVHADYGTISVMAGFLLMMVLDVTLG